MWQEDCLHNKISRLILIHMPQKCCFLKDKHELKDEKGRKSSMPNYYIVPNGSQIPRIVCIFSVGIVKAKKVNGRGKNDDNNFKKLLFWLILFYCIDGAKCQIKAQLNMHTLVTLTFTPSRKKSVCFPNTAHCNRCKFPQSSLSLRSNSSQVVCQCQLDGCNLQLNCRFDSFVIWDGLTVTIRLTWTEIYRSPFIKLQFPIYDDLAQASNI